MNNNNVIILKNSAILFARLIFTAVISLVSVRIIMQGLGMSDFGLYNVVGNIVVMMTFINSGMHTTTFRFIAFEMGKDSERGINKVFNISILLHLVLFFLIILLSETLGVFYLNNYLNVNPDKLGDALFVLRFSTYAAAIGVLGIPFNALITAKEKFNIQAIIEIVRSVLLLTAAVGIIFISGNKLRLYAVLILGANAMPPILYFLYCRINYSKIITWNIQKESKKYKEMVGFSGWIMFGAAASISKNSGSALIINNFFGTIVNASFGIANQVNSVISILSRNLGQAAIPQITKNYSNDNVQSSVVLSSHISKYTMFLMFLIAFPILVKTEYILTLWLGKLPPYTVIFTQLIICNALVDGLGGGLISLVQATGKIKYFQIVLSITSLISLPIAYFFFNMGYNPATILVIFIFTAILNVVFMQMLLKSVINFNVKEFLQVAYFKVFYVVLAFLPIAFFIRFVQDGVVPLILIFLVTELWLLTSIYFLGLDTREKRIIKEVTILTIKKINRYLKI